MALPGSYRRDSELRAATQLAPAKERLTVERLRRRATDRKVILLDCAIVRHAPFSADGRAIWDLLPEFKWFTDYRKSRLQEEPSARISAHEAIEIVERMADGSCTPDELHDTHHYLKYTEWHAEADRFGYDEARLPGSELRYGVAYWIDGLADVKPENRNIFDFYITAYQGIYYAWAHTEPLHGSHRAVALSLIEDLFGNTLRPVTFSPAWRTDTAVSLAKGMYESRGFSAMPILADALQDTGCDNEDILNHCRDANGIHVRGCWVVDLVLGLS